MSTQIYNTCPDMLETLSHEFNGNNIYGLEFIIDEINEGSQSINNDPANTDWFGLSDLCM